MRSIFDFVIQPKKSRYQNTKQVGDKELIINTEIFNHQYVSREATVIATPTTLDTPIQVGDDVIVHHNIFRRWHNVRGEEKNSRNYISEDTYLCRGQKFWGKARARSTLEHDFEYPTQLFGKAFDKCSLKSALPC